LDTPLADDDRDALTEALAQHAAAGRLTIAEHEARVANVLRARTREQAARALEGLPPLPPQGRAQRRLRGHGEASAPGAAWLPTAERFRDPASGRLLRVWVDPVSGERHYVLE
jgi:hypothetical protein